MSYFRIQVIRRVLGILAKQIRPILQVLTIEAQRRSERLEIIENSDFENNPYRKVHLRAEANKQRSIKEQNHAKWHENPLKFIDPEDLFLDGGEMRSHDGLMAIANEVLSQKRGTSSILEDLLNGKLPGSRDVEREVFMDMLRSSLARMGNKFTQAQLDAIILEREAKQVGKTASMHIAEERGTTPQSALRLLKRAKKAILVQNGQAVDIIEVEKHIKEHARSLDRYCVSCGKQCEDGLHSLCPACHRRFVYKQDFLNDAHRREIEDSMRVSSMTHWRKARQMFQAT